jgi:hypothetical protein
MIAAAVILAVLLLFAFLPLGIVAEYGSVADSGTTVGAAGENTQGGKAGLIAYAKAGPVRYRVYPPKKGREKPAKKKAGEGVMKAGRLEELKNQLPAISKLLGRLRRKLVIKELTIHYLAAGEDPFETALWFGGAHVGYGFLLPLLENNFKIKKRDLRASVSFTTTEPYIYVRARLSLAVWEAVYVLWALLGGMLKSGRTTSKTRKAV